MSGDSELRFSMEGRNRRPPTDPVNALLSFGYSMLTRSFVVALSAVGFDPFRGFFHQPRYGRPALALDMMEPFRSLIVDSCVITAINNGEIDKSLNTAACSRCRRDCWRAFCWVKYRSTRVFSRVDHCSC